MLTAALNDSPIPLEDVYLYLCVYIHGLVCSCGNVCAADNVHNT